MNLDHYNELLRAAYEAERNEERLNAYLDKKAKQESCEPDWWTYEDNDTLWVDSHETR